MPRWPRSKTTWWSALAACGSYGAWQAWCLQRALRRGRQLAQAAHPVQSNPPRPVARLLLGDSTGVGVGAEEASQTLAGLIAAAYPHAVIVNQCRNGMRVADVAAAATRMADTRTRFDVALVLAGGNDVLKRTPHRELSRHAHTLLQALQRTTRHVVWLGSADIGRAPALPGPLAWWASRRCRSAMRLLAGIAARHGVAFVDFAAARHSERFAARPDLYFADDGLHPSSASYRVCFDVLQREVPLANWLAAPLRTH